MLKNIEVQKTAKSRLDPAALENPGFGTIFSDHMLSMDFSDGRWGEPMVVPFGNLEVSPALTTLHYGQAIFEGLKAFHAPDGSINIFRPDKYHERMLRSSARLCIPQVSYDDFLAGLSTLVKTDRDWVPKKKGYSLYIRPFIFASDNYLGVRVSETYKFLIITSPVGAYYKEGINPVRLTTPGEYVRAVKGGLGAAKTPANYAASLLPAEEAKKKGFTQVLWLDAIERRYVEEVGTMNIFFLIADELVTPSLEGSVLGGVTRDSVIRIAKEWGVKVCERRISIDELFAACGNGSLKEAFGTGTAAVISPVGEIHHQGAYIRINNGETGPFARKLYDYITSLQYGEAEDRFGWVYTIPAE
ncbi:MAG TPA: branched chain amino acid aminotransferase [Deltaproteobacteria bacterium]|nr:MAG: branched chain amino acid aminotransferase [Deltaproteobacteria bacterium GWA2_55_82]OGQ63331.1 MAG: branched chain amino acid aminotransferase [Deltaproteobacteria bacterium RIFCSPLOWO2_02_FULL_55_12]OIJ75006.1 MAG: branched chain amino acid aminotransferase [Deltaproteobacteria bacterium GWC2_55_46]HAO93453.1 branched chain amino acid aminotransferase [Deltaproteobacteria bacterium]HBG47894.1 branched chain amino acid aminotransferase [Deltaproteobacteria bacterium]